MNSSINTWIALRNERIRQLRCLVTALSGADELAVEWAIRHLDGLPEHWVAADERGHETASRQPAYRDEEPGDWMDKWGACKVCGGEIPEGHAQHCQLWKLQMAEAGYKSALEDIAGTRGREASSPRKLAAEVLARYGLEKNQC